MEIKFQEDCVASIKTRGISEIAGNESKWEKLQVYRARIEIALKEKWRNDEWG